MERFYDSLGFLSPVTVQFKVFMQELCKSELTWDQSLEGEALSKWHSLLDDLEKNQPAMIPRQFLPNPKDESRRYRLYGFCDASAAADNPKTWTVVSCIFVLFGGERHYKFICSVEFRKAKVFYWFPSCTVLDKGCWKGMEVFCLTLSGGNLQVGFCELLESFHW